jgi:hypothetical protein
LKSLIDCFGIPSLFQAISSKIPFPQTLGESLQFISQSYSEFLGAHFNQSMLIIIQNFNLISFDDLNRFSNSHLLKIFSSESLQIENEDYLFQLIIQMIEEDKNRIILLKTVHLEFVSSDLLKKFFENIQNDEIDFELFESLKKRLFSDYSNQRQIENRWKTKPKILSQQEIPELFDILYSYFGEEKNPIDQVKLLINQIEQLKRENEKFKNLSLKIRTISHQNNVNGILQDLKRAEPHSFSFNCSSIYPSYQPSNLLIYDSSRFLSQNQPNQWLSIKFNTKKIIFFGYLFRSYYNASSACNLKTWILEGSQDNINWVLIDNQINRIG